MANLMHRLPPPTTLRRYPAVGRPPFGKELPTTYRILACGDVTLYKSTSISEPRKGGSWRRSMCKYDTWDGENQHGKTLSEFGAAPCGAVVVHRDKLRGFFRSVYHAAVAPVSKGVCLVHEVGRKQDHSALALSLQHAPCGATTERIHA